MKVSSKPQVIVLCLLAAMYYVQPAFAQDVEAKDFLELAGCYALDLHATGQEAPFTEVERRLWLTTVELAPTSEHSSYVVRPAPGELAGTFEAVYWTKGQDDDPALTIVWSSGFHGISLRARASTPQYNTWTGEASTFTDQLGALSTTAAVTLHSIDCDAA